MLTIELRFPAGRYHATPWGRAVNEGVAEWPPSPFRLARALIDAARRRHPRWPDQRLAEALEPLHAPFSFRLPPVTTAHTRAFLHSNKPNPTSRQKIFDAFVAIQRHRVCQLAFQADPSQQVREDLAILLRDLDYLGRSESWIEASLLPPQPSVPSPSPADLDWRPATASDLHAANLLRVACVRSPASYLALPRRPSRTIGKGRGRKQVELSWLEALSMGTGALENDGWSDPPALEWRTYVSPPEQSARLRDHGFAGTATFHMVRYALFSPVLPRIQSTLPVAEQVRVRLMGIHRAIRGGDPSLVSPVFSGKQPDGKPLRGHAHAFFLPRDLDADGFIDHLDVWARHPFSRSELAALDRLTSLWQSRGRPSIHLVLLSATREPLAGVSDTWISQTPFLVNRHYKKNRGPYLQWLEGELRRECEHHALPSPCRVEWTNSVKLRGHEIPWWDFVRSRKGTPARRAFGCRITFEKPVAGPLVLGSLSHFGLGQFMPLE